MAAGWRILNAVTMATSIGATLVGGRAFLLAAVLAGAMLVSATKAGGQPPPKPIRSIVTVNPLGLLQFGPTVEWEVLSSPVGFATGLRVPTFGLLAHLIDDQLGFAWLGTASLRIHGSKGPRGWWVAPRGEWGRANSGGSVYSLSGGGLEVGYNWISETGRVIAAGTIVGAFKSESGLEGRFIMGVASIGIAR